MSPAADADRESEASDAAGEAATVRRATRRDLAPVLALWVDLIEHHRRLDPRYPSMPSLLELLRGELQRALGDERCRILVAEAPDGLCGFLLAEVEEARPPAPLGSGSAGTGAPSCWIHELYVSPERRRSGLGGRLVAEIEPFFESRRGGRRCVRVEASNGAGLSFWERHGYAERARLLERDPETTG